MSHELPSSLSSRLCSSSNKKLRNNCFAHSFTFCTGDVPHVNACHSDGLVQLVGSCGRHLCLGYIGPQEALDRTTLCPLRCSFTHCLHSGAGLSRNHRLKTPRDCSGVLGDRKQPQVQTVVRFKQSWRWFITHLLSRGQSSALHVPHRMEKGDSPPCNV